MDFLGLKGEIKMNKVSKKLAYISKIDYKSIFKFIYALASIVIMIVVCIDYLKMLLMPAFILISILRIIVVASCSYNIYIFYKIAKNSFKKIKK